LSLVRVQDSVRARKEIAMPVRQALYKKLVMGVVGH